MPPRRFASWCSDAEERFETEERCLDPEVSTNCPLTCSESSTTGLFVVVVDSTIVLPLQETIPTGDDELLLFKSALIQALQSSFLLSSSSASSVVVTDIQLVPITNARGAVNNFDAEFNISADISCNPNCATAQTGYEETARSVALEIYSGNKGSVFASAVTIHAGEEPTVITTATQTGQEMTAVPTKPRFP